MSTKKTNSGSNVDELIKIQTEASEDSLKLAKNAVQNNKRQAEANTIQAASEVEAKASKNAAESTKGLL